MRLEQDVLFQDRNDAGRRLALALAAYEGKHPLILAIPRGAVPMGRLIAEALHGELDVVLVRKLGAPGSPEFAVGAVNESGWTYVADHARSVGADAAYLSREAQRQVETLKRRRFQYTPGRSPLDPAGRTVIVVDDGLATGATMIAALHSVRGANPAWLVCAVPVAAPESVDLVRTIADDVVCLAAPQEFHAVGQFYVSFPQVTDEEVIAILSPQTPAGQRLTQS